MTASAVPSAAFAENLGRVVERTVLERTHLTGLMISNWNGRRI